MKVIPMPGWIFYLDPSRQSELNHAFCGKWMYFFSDRSFAEKICKEAVEAGVVVESKHSDSNEGVCCFYLDGRNGESHKKVISYFLKNDLIRKTKTGRLYNIAFKFDSQTDSGEYGAGFCPQIKLADFIDLNTGKWKEEGE